MIFLKRMYMYFQMHIHVFYQNTKAEPDALALGWFIEIGQTVQRL